MTRIKKEDINSQPPTCVMPTRRRRNYDRERRQFTRAPIAKASSMQVSIKTLVISKESVRCKLALQHKTIEQAMLFVYLALEINLCQNRINEVKDQVNKSSQISSTFQDIISNNMNTYIKDQNLKYIKPLTHTNIRYREQTTK